MENSLLKIVIIQLNFENVLVIVNSFFIKLLIRKLKNSILNFVIFISLKKKVKSKNNLVIL